MSGWAARIHGDRLVRGMAHIFIFVTLLGQSAFCAAFSEILTTGVTEVTGEHGGVH
jgi:hypothetical protein